LAACGGQAPTGATVLPPEEMPGGFDGPNVTDDTGTSVTVRFTTGVPTACNVVYGTNTTYGNLAVMPMMGGAVREHAVTLDGLAPETIYHYRITATDEQGRVYQSQDFTFTTGVVPSEDEGLRPEGENVASLAAGARVVGVSSNWGGENNDSAFGANKAIDGQPNTAWSSNGDGDDAWIEIELAQVYEVHTIGFWTRTMSNNTAQIFSFTVTTDGGETFGPFDLPDADRIYTFPVQFTARRLRFDAVETNTGNTGTVEIEVYGTPHEP
ncbi:MAG: discoidin domain-containing protein, partial [Chloroflexota bacterium]|nr:discoidin domain-containing protein [Chloroflexota bacterium]